MQIKFNKYSIFEILIFNLIIITSFIFDFLWINTNNFIPAWDQGFHLSNLFNYSNLINEIKLFDKDWWESFWSVTDNYRGPLTYIISSIYIKLFGASIENAILSNFIFNLITLLSIFIFSKKFLNTEAGLWATLMFSFNPFIFSLRNDYLIDLPQVSFLILSWLLLTIWYFARNSNILFSLFSGGSIGLLFLTKPTGIVFLIFPIGLLIYKKFSFKNLKENINIISFLLAFILCIKNWLFLNWLTILTSTINAFNWGIKYQDGLDINTIEGWFYYLFELIKIFNPFIIFSFITLKIFNHYKFNKNNNFKLNYKSLLSNRKIWFLSAPLNIILINLLMTSKDPRFILPLIPFLYLLLGNSLANIRNKYKTNLIIKGIFACIVLITFLTNQIQLYSGIKNFEAYENPNKIHNEIIDEISNNSPYIDSTIGVLPDTKYFNAFNLDAASLRLKKRVRSRQIISNQASYKTDIQLFDWFLIKTGEQGTMTTFAKDKLQKELLESNDFVIQKKWKLQDHSILSLLKRKNISEKVNLANCTNKTSFINFYKSKNNLRFEIYGPLRKLNKSYLLINSNDPNIKTINISLPKININFFDEKCIYYDYNFTAENYNFIANQPEEIEAYIYRSEENSMEKVDINFNNSLIIDEKKSSLNKIDIVSQLGIFLKNGEFDKLFNLAGLINQSDPKSDYLKDSELIFTKRLSMNSNELNNLYAVAISQILQRKAYEASLSLNKILLIDKENSYAYLAKGFVNLYSFNIKEANDSFEKAIVYNNNNDFKDIIEKIYFITKIINFKFLMF